MKVHKVLSCQIFYCFISQFLGHLGSLEHIEKRLLMVYLSDYLKKQSDAKKTYMKFIE